jgi:hypothetical protein
MPPCLPVLPLEMLTRERAALEGESLPPSGQVLNSDRKRGTSRRCQSYGGCPIACPSADGAFGSPQELRETPREIFDS